MPSLTPLLGAPAPPPAPEHVFPLHSALIHAVALLPDDDTLVSSSEDGSVLVSSIRDGSVIGELQAHDGPVNTLALTPDGGLLVTGGDDHDVLVWDTRTLECLRVLSGHSAYVRRVAVSRGRALSGAEDQTLRVWDLDTGACERVLEGHGEHIRAVAISPDGRLGAASSLDHALWVWDLDTGEVVHKLIPGGAFVARVPGFNLYMSVGGEDGAAHQEAASEILFLDGGRRLLSLEREIVLWDLQRGAEIARLPRQGWSLQGLLLHPDGQRLIAGGRAIQLWNLAARRRAGLLDVGGRHHRAFALTRDGARLITGTEEGAVTVWSLADAAARPSTPAQAEPVTDLCVAPPYVAGLASDGSVSLWHAGEGLVLPIEAHNEANGKPPALSADGRTLVTLAEREGIHVWDTRTRALRRRLPPIEHEERRVTPHAIALLPGERALVGALGPGLFEVDLTGAAAPAPFAGRVEQISAIAVAPDGRRAYTLGYFADNPAEEALDASREQLQAWDLGARALRWTVAATHPEGAEYPLSFGFVAAAPRGDLLVVNSGVAEGQLAVLSAESGEPVRHIPLPGGGYAAHPRFLSDELLAVLVSVFESDTPPRLLRVEVTTGRVLGDLPLPVGEVYADAVSADASTLAFSAGEELLVLDGSRGEVLARFDCRARIRSLSLAPDGSLLAAGDFAGRTHLFRIDR